MTRSNAREIAVHFVFELGFSGDTAQELLDRALTREAFALLGEEEELYAEFPNAKQYNYIFDLVRGVFDRGVELDRYIEKYAVGWKFKRIDRVAAAIMRVTMYEILYMPDIPTRVAINEAVEIAKKYGAEETVRFINGILGSFVRGELPQEDSAQSETAPPEDSAGEEPRE